MDLRNCYAIREVNQRVLDKRGGFSRLVSRHCSFSLEEKESAVFIEVVISDCRPGVITVI